MRRNQKSGKKTATFSRQQWLTILVGLVLQLFVLFLVALGLILSGTPDVMFASTPDRSGACRIIRVTAFSDAWINGIQPGMSLRTVALEDTTNELGVLNHCQPTKRTILAQVSEQAIVLRLNTAPQFLNLSDLIVMGLLTIIFSLTGITIFLHAQDRPVAHTAYSLFYFASLIFCLLSVHSSPWIYGLLYLLTIITRGMAATFVCLLPDQSAQPGRRKRSPLPYIPLIIGILLGLVCLPMQFWLPQARQIIALVLSGYTIVCIATVAWVMFWGLRDLTRHEQQIARMVVVGIVFFLLSLALNNSASRYSTFVLNSFTNIYNIPLMILPLVCGYALIRHQLLGTSALLSRQVMRVLLWLFLASFFVVPSVILLRFIESRVQIGGTPLVYTVIPDYLYTFLLLVSFWLFPLCWSKMRNVGDQILYHDFYQYNRSLCELSYELTRLRHLEQIGLDLLPRVATLLNATGIALLVRMPQTSGPSYSPPLFREGVQWRPYHHAQQPFLPLERLHGIVNVALTQVALPSYEPLLLDGVLLLALYDGDRISGFLCLGSKLNYEAYSRQDVSFLATLAAQLSVLEVNSRYLEQARADAVQLAALNHRVISAQEDERRHLALELHDEVLQQAMLLLRQLSDASSMADVAEVMPLARSMVTCLRRACLELRPPLLDELGLDEALLWLGRQAEQRSNVQVELRCPGAIRKRPAAQIELALYRVVQEALSNMLKYAEASSAIIRLSYRSSGWISVLIRDNGRGFSRSQPLTENLGLAGMHERMVAVGGTLHIRSSPGQGTTILARAYVVASASIQSAELSVPNSATA